MCHDGAALVACSAANTGDAAIRPRQDGRFGRDAQAAAGQLTKTDGGAAGVDFTPPDAADQPIALAGGVPAATPACVRDNVTALIWEVKTVANMNDTYTFAGAAADAGQANTDGLCGFNAGWRVPTRGELLSIVRHGTSSPAIDADFFPNTVSGAYWSSDVYALVPALAWVVNFDNGNSNADMQSGDFRVRLVRSGQCFDALAAVAGACGRAAGVASLVAPSSNLCAAGTTGAVACAGGAHAWSCAGSGGGATAGCAVEFVLAGCTGASATLRLSFSGPVAGMRYWKYLGGAWQEMTGATLAGNTVTFTIEDNGLFDTDPTVGRIADPSGPGIAAALGGVAAVPTLSEWAAMSMAGLLVLMAWGGLRRRV